MARLRSTRVVKSAAAPPPGWRNSDETDDDSEIDPNDQQIIQDDGEEDMVDEEDSDEEEEIDPSEPFGPLIPECAQSHRPHSDEVNSSGMSTIRTLILIVLSMIVISFLGYFILGPKEVGLHIIDLKESLMEVIASYSNPFSFKEAVTETLDNLTPWDKFKHKFKTEFTPKYLNAVPKSSIKVIKAAVKDVMVAFENSDQSDLSPSVILILGKEGNKNVSCFSRDLERIIASSYNEGNPIRLNGDSIDSSGIDDAFIDVFQNKKQHLIVIDGLNKLDGKSAAHLHRFTDHGSSIFKEAIIILLGYTDQVAQLKSESSLKEMDSVASNLIMKLWAQTLPSDTIAPLISRLTPSVTAVLDWDGQVTIC